MNVSATLMKKWKLYGQLALDEFFLKEIRSRSGWWANKQGWQLGFRHINAFGIAGLRLQAEYNEVRPYTYTHSAPEQNYSHYGFPLAHPLGANFREFSGTVALRRGRWEWSAQGMSAHVGKDSSGVSNVGQNIFLSYTTRPFDYGHVTTQGVGTQIMQGQLKWAWFVLPALNMRLELSYTQRSERNDRKYELQNPWLSLSLRTGIWNSYRDF
jgi:hypothetical protein